MTSQTEKMHESQCMLQNLKLLSPGRVGNSSCSVVHFTTSFCALHVSSRQRMSTAAWVGYTSAAWVDCTCDDLEWPVWYVDKNYTARKIRCSAASQLWVYFWYGAFGQCGRCHACYPSSLSPALAPSSPLLVCQVVLSIMHIVF